MELGEGIVVWDKDDQRISPIKKLKTYGQYEEELGQKIAERAEVIAAMDCIMHHLNDEDDFFQWTSVAVRDENNWNLLDWDPGEGACRCEAYMNIARNMSDNAFECICRTFADIVRAQCFSTSYREGAFAFAGRQNAEDRP